MDLKDIFINEVQKNVNGTIYTQELNNKLECIVKRSNKSSYVVFKYNDNQVRTWNFEYKLFSNSLSSNLICIFICKDEKDYFEYHIITSKELLSLSNLDVLDLIKYKDKEYIFEDFNCIYKDNWNVF